MRTPTSLKLQPVIEASFELRFSLDTQISEIVPGYLFHSLDCQKPVENLPGSQIPKNVRDSDENLHYVILHRLEWDNYHIGISDHGISLSSSLKYDGWTQFKEAILTIINEIKKLKLHDKLIRYSLKYVDFFEKTDSETSLFDKLNIEFQLHGESLGGNQLSLRLEKKEDDFDTAIQILTHALVLSEDGSFNKKGLILDIDTIKNLTNDEDVKTFNNSCEGFLKSIHDKNKLAFFKCLKESTIESLEPIYD